MRRELEYKRPPVTIADIGEPSLPRSEPNIKKISGDLALCSVTIDRGLRAEQARAALRFIVGLAWTLVDGTVSHDRDDLGAWNCSLLHCLVCAPNMELASS
jgi:hypothetical protein